MADQATTLGTTSVLIDCEEGGNSVEGFLTVSERSSGALVLTVLSAQADPTATTLSCWQGSASFSDLQKLKWEDDVVRQRLCSVLATQTAKDEQMESHFVLTGDDISLALHQQTSGIRRTLWKTTLSKALGPAALQLFQSLHGELGTTQDKLMRAKEEKEAYRVAADAYRETAEKLEGAWNREKTELLGNFLRVYRARGDIIQQQDKEMTDLRQPMEHAPPSTGKAAPTAAASRPDNNPDFIHNEPVDGLNLASDTLDCLARGERVPDTYTSTGMYTSTSTGTSNGTQPDALASRAAKKARRNKVTGVKEYLDAESAIADLFGEENKKDTKEAPVNEANQKAAVRSIKTVSARRARRPADFDSDSDTNESHQRAPPVLKARRGAVDTTDSDTSDDRRPPVHKSPTFQALLRRRAADADTDSDE